MGSDWKGTQGGLLRGLILFCFSIGVCSICDNSLSGILMMLGTFLYILYLGQKFKTIATNNKTYKGPENGSPLDDLKRTVCTTGQLSQQSCPLCEMSQQRIANMPVTPFQGDLRSRKSSLLNRLFYF